MHVLGRVEGSAGKRTADASSSNCDARPCAITTRRLSVVDCTAEVAAVSRAVPAIVVIEIAVSDSTSENPRRSPHWGRLEGVLIELSRPPRVRLGPARYEQFSLSRAGVVPLSVIAEAVGNAERTKKKGGAARSPRSSQLALPRQSCASLSRAQRCRSCASR